MRPATLPERLDFLRFFAWTCVGGGDGGWMIGQRAFVTRGGRVARDALGLGKKSGGGRSRKNKIGAAG